MFTPKTVVHVAQMLHLYLFLVLTYTYFYSVSTCTELFFTFIFYSRIKRTVLIFALFFILHIATVLPANSVSDVMFCLQSYQGPRID